MHERERERFRYQLVMLKGNESCQMKPKFRTDLKKKKKRKKTQVGVNDSVVKALSY